MLKKILLQYKIDTFGVTNVTDFSYLKKIFFDKKDKGYFANFDEQDFQKRANLDNILSGIQSIISIAFPYDTQESIYNPSDYKISKYAIRKDYHLTVKMILNNIILDLKKIYPNNKFEIFVDSNPLFEKEIAQKSGLGFYGKNSLLYTEKYGSFVFFGEIITDLFISGKNEDFFSKCNNCDICSNACPNNAIHNGILDASNCIAYLTNTKDEVNPSKIYNNFWGCDICQDVCPLNIKKEKSPLDEFSIIQNLFLPLEEIIFISNKKLQKYYSESAIGWTGANILKRNAIILMGNSKDIKHIPFLKKFIHTTHNDMLLNYAQKSLKKLI